MRAESNPYVRAGFAKGPSVHEANTHPWRRARNKILLGTILGFEALMVYRYFFGQRPVPDEVRFFQNIEVCVYGSPGKAKINSSFMHSVPPPKGNELAPVCLVRPALIGEGHFSFSERVEKFIQRPGDAALEHGIVHVGLERTTRPAPEMLVKAYRNILHEFAYSRSPTLRLCPLASHIVDPDTTLDVLHSAFQELFLADRQILTGSSEDHGGSGRKVQLCVFSEEERHTYEKKISGLIT